MTNDKQYPVSDDAKQRAHLSIDQYQDLYQKSINAPETFWPEMANEFLTWSKPWEQLTESNLMTGTAGWFIGGKLNACYNCVDRHLPERAQQTAILWEGDDPSQQATITYQDLHQRVCQLANLLIQRGVKKGDRVCLYMPMIPEAAYAMLACARIGAVHSVVFGGFSPQALQDRILDSDCQTVITADEGVRGGKTVPLKVNADLALEQCPNVHSVIVVRHTGGFVSMQPERDLWYMTHRYVFDYHDGDIYWCTADVGWVTGHTYIVYGPLANGATTLMFEGIPNYPDASRCWQIVDKHQVNIFYTAPTALRALMGMGNEFVQATNRSSLRILGSVGEPINPEAWEWYYHIVGDGRCPIVDTWWQTETGGIMITPLPGVTDLKPGSATLPFFGVEPVLLDPEGNVLSGATSGNLAIRSSWPSQIRTVFGDHQRCIDTYYTTYPGYYFTGDGARRDESGYYWITGRVDDVLNVSGHRMGTAEVESALVLHEAVAEAAVVGYPHNIKGQGIYAYVTLMQGVEGTDTLKRELENLVRQEIGAIAKPDILQWAPMLPKTRSGKIMRRILRKIAENELTQLGDTSTLADPSVVDDLIANSPQTNA